jgi:hypothetical protein
VGMVDKILWNTDMTNEMRFIMTLLNMMNDRYDLAEEEEAQSS